MNKYLYNRMILVDFMYILNGVSFNIFCPDNQQLPCFKIDDSTCKENTAMKIMLLDDMDEYQPLFQHLTAMDQHASSYGWMVYHLYAGSQISKVRATH